MGFWNVDADTLAGSRFVVSPMAETFAGLICLHRTTADLSRELRGAYRARLAADPVDAAVMDAVLRPRWIADFASPVPLGTSFAEEAAVVRAASPARVRADLITAFTAGRPSSSSFALSPLLDRDDLADRVADLLTWVWEHVVEPDWEQRRRLILEADVVARTRQLTLEGWAGALDRMRDGMRWLGEGRLQINVLNHPPKDISGTGLSFVPVTMSRGWVARSPGRHAVIYQCSGLLASPDASLPGALGRLLGEGRARVLLELGAPKSTTQLVAITGQGLGSVGRHLKILLEAGLVLRRRAGRSVLYARTPVGDALVLAAR
ncbi:transcriptional regulator [Actinoplanes sp. OR16]|uniref:winged helix-turn-helix domain-containing protein n=1 Tax=Actinoplanes sp. OR16 TaxID=946334 RepID=UPI000F6F624E|nr:winged helix-turn-helix domain-containing protein [Actinoplanes sp. OR16]BBH66922.1 transcriptional regulator [Actinoplanes sp. OR16]